MNDDLQKALDVIDTTRLCADDSNNVETVISAAQTVAAVLREQEAEIDRLKFRVQYFEKRAEKKEERVAALNHQVQAQSEHIESVEQEIRGKVLRAIEDHGGSEGWFTNKYPLEQIIRATLSTFESEERRLRMENTRLRRDNKYLRSTLKTKCQCQFDGSSLIHECHWHACYRSGTNGNGDPLEWNLPNAIKCTDTPPIDEARAEIDRLQKENASLREESDAYRVARDYWMLGWHKATGNEPPDPNTCELLQEETEPPMSNDSFGVGDYRTRNGLRAHIQCIMPAEAHSVYDRIGWVVSNSRVAYLQRWSSHGRNMEGEGEESDFDLMLSEEDEHE